jgi:hypothetical protein
VAAGAGAGWVGAGAGAGGAAAGAEAAGAWGVGAAAGAGAGRGAGGGVAAGAGAGRGAAGTVGAAAGVGLERTKAGPVDPGCSDAGRLVTRRAPERLIGVVDPPPSGRSPAPVAGAEAGGVSPSGFEGAVSGWAEAATFLAAAFLVALAGAAGSSGWTGRRRPSRSAFLRARSACASSMDDEWLLTPIPRERQRSRASLLVRPSSWASS